MNITIVMINQLSGEKLHRQVAQVAERRQKVAQVTERRQKMIP